MCTLESLETSYNNNYELAIRETIFISINILIWYLEFGYDYSKRVTYIVSNMTMTMTMK